MPSPAAGAAAGAAAGSVIPGIGTAIGAIGGAAISAIGNFFSGKSNQKAQNALFEKQSQFARDERLAQQNWIESMYEKNNAYNSPAAQMARYKEAGLNPDLIYGKTGDNSATSPSAPSQAPVPNAGNYLPANPIAPIGDAVQGLSMQQAQLDAIRAGTNKTNKESRQLDITNASLPDQLRVELSNAIKSGKLTDKDIEKRNVEIGQIQASTQSILENIKLTQVEILGKQDEIDYRAIQRAMDSEEFTARMKAMQMKYDLDKQQFEHLQRFLPKLLSEKDLTNQSLANQIWLQSQEIQYQKDYGDVLQKGRFNAENYEYNARAAEATTRKADAEARLPKVQSTRAYNESRYGDQTSFYGKVNLCISDMLSVLKGLLSIGH